MINTYEFQVAGVTLSYKYYNEGLCHTHHEEEFMIRDNVWDIREGMYCVDMGAGCGDYTLTACKRGAARVYAFEPYPESQELLRRNVILNKWQDLCVLSSLGLSSDKRAGTAKMDTTTMTISPEGKLPITLVTLDKFIEGLSYPPPRLDWIHIDIECEEIEAAYGMVHTVRQYHPKILVEIHKPNTIKQFLSVIDDNYAAESLLAHKDSGDNSHWLCVRRQG